MPGLKYFYISEDNKIYSVPNPSNHNDFKPIQHLKNQNALLIMLYYSTFNRKPHELIFVEFFRVTLDSEGAFKYSDKESDKIMNNTLQFIFSKPEDYLDNNNPIELPLAKSIPNLKEKQTLYEFLELKYPSLYKNAPLIVERTIASLKQSHADQVKFVKKAYKLKNKIEWFPL